MIFQITSQLFLLLRQEKIKANAKLVYNKKDFNKANNAAFKQQLHSFFYKQRFFSAQPQCCLTFSWIELKMLLNIKPLLYWYTFYIYYICVHVLAQVYLCRIFVICFSFSAPLLLSLIIKRHFLEYFLLFWGDTVNEENEKFSNSECSASGCCLAFA